MSTACITFCFLMNNVSHKRRVNDTLKHTFRVETDNISSLYKNRNAIKHTKKAYYLQRLKFWENSIIPTPSLRKETKESTRSRPNPRKYPIITSNNDKIN